MFRLTFQYPRVLTSRVFLGMRGNQGSLKKNRYLQIFHRFLFLFNKNTAWFPKKLLQPFFTKIVNLFHKAEKTFKLVIASRQNRTYNSNLISIILSNQIRLNCAILQEEWSLAAINLWTNRFLYSNSLVLIKRFVDPLYYLADNA